MENEYQRFNKWPFVIILLGLIIFIIVVTSESNLPIPR